MRILIISLFIAFSSVDLVGQVNTTFTNDSIQKIEVIVEDTLIIIGGCTRTTSFPYYSDADSIAILLDGIMTTQSLIDGVLEAFEKSYPNYLRNSSAHNRRLWTLAKNRYCGNLDTLSKRHESIESLECHKWVTECLLNDYLILFDEATIKEEHK